MNSIYWICRYKPDGKNIRVAMPLLLTLRSTRRESIAGLVNRQNESWSSLRKKYNLECVKVRIVDFVPERQRPNENAIEEQNRE